MSDRMPAEISIGGPVLRGLVQPLIRAIKYEGVRLTRDEEPFEAASAQDLLELVQRGTGILCLMDHEVAWGRFDDLEDFLVKHGIAFDRWNEARYDYDSQLVQFRPGMKLPHVWLSSQVKQPLVSLEVLKALDGSLKRQQHRQAMEIIKRYLGPTIAPLEPLQILAPVPRPTKAAPRRKSASPK